VSLQTRFFTLDQLSHLPAPQWMVEGLFEANSLVMLSGPPGVYKSFLAIDWMMCMASGIQWHGKKTIPSRVLYVLGEGKSSLLKRCQAWATYHKVAGERLNDNFRVTFDVPAMAMKSSVDNMLAGLEAEKYVPNVVVIDTFARSFVGMDENSQEDVGLWIESAERLRNQGMTVIFLHHTAKNTEFGLKYRGSSALQGAVDTAMILARDNSGGKRICLKVDKQKDHDEGDPLYFTPQVICTDPNDTEGSVVLVPTVQLDERFTEDGKEASELATSLILDPNFKMDVDRANVLAMKFGISVSAAKKRISERRRSMGFQPEPDYQPYEWERQAFGS
jgi:hypothetical protein